MSPRLTRNLLFSGALLLFVLLFIAPKTAPATEKAVARNSTANISSFEEKAVKSLKPEKKALFERWGSAGKTDSLIDGWLKERRPDISAFYAEKKAIKEGSAKSWLNAGNRYYNAVQFCEDPSEVPVLYESAMRSFEKARALDPENDESKLMLARCLVEGTDKPMDGITMLKELEKKDSLNADVNLAFAFFSVKSGQLDKAIKRFEKVLRADSTYIEAYLRLADCYEQLGDTANTIMMLEKYSARTPDVTVKNELRKYIDQLKFNNKNN